MALFDNLLGQAPRRQAGFFDMLGRAERRPSLYRQPNLMSQTSAPVRQTTTTPAMPVRPQPVEAPQDITQPIPVQLPGTSPFIEGPQDPRIRAAILGILPPPAAPLSLPPAPPENPMGLQPMIDREELQRVIARFLASYLPQALGNPSVPIGNTPVYTEPV